MRRRRRKITKEPMKMGLLERKKFERSERQRKVRIKVGIGVAVAVVALTVICVKWKPWEHIKFPSGGSVPTANVGGGKDKDKVSKETLRKEAIEKAEYLTQTYDYDKAIETLKSVEGYEKDTEIKEQIDDIKAIKATCVPVKLEEVTHIFYHTLVVDAKRAFANQEKDNQAVGNNQWMTTIDEFNAITQEMYDRGYVMVSIHDLYEVTKDENGNETWSPAEILLPPDKKAFVLSLDDLSYYHSYDNYGYATKLIIDENGDVMNEYTDANGKTTIGAYDCVPLMDRFVEKHPDASYRGAKGIIALTGYNGVLGYRTDFTYDLSLADCDRHQRAWIAAHPDFNLENERAQAKKVADAMKANGWEFASHTWGHVRVGDRSLAALKVDNEKWMANVKPIVGETDTIIFAHGQDLHGIGAYPESNEKYQYFRDQGFRIFCNVDSTKYQTFLGKDYMRQGRRNLDGYRIYYNAIGDQNNVSDLFDAAKILDPDRPPVPPL